MIGFRSLFRRREPAIVAPESVWPTMEPGKLAPIGIPAASDRDADGRFVSEHRRKVHEKCREQCAAIGREVPEALR